MLQKNDSVKVLMPPEWKVGRILRQVGLDTYDVGIGEPHYFNYEVITVNKTEIYPYERLSDEDLEKSASEQLPQVIEQLGKALTEILPGEYFLHANVKDNVIPLYHGAITIEPCIYEQRRIGSFKEVPGWSVTHWTNTAATRDEPENTDECTLGSFPHYGDAIKLAIESVFKCKSDDYWNAQADAALAQAWADGEM
jgi:hypothetical protein